DTGPYGGTLRRHIDADTKRAAQHLGWSGAAFGPDWRADTGTLTGAAVVPLGSGCLLSVLRRCPGVHQCPNLLVAGIWLLAWANAVAGRRATTWPSEQMGTNRDVAEPWESRPSPDGAGKGRSRDRGGFV